MKLTAPMETTLSQRANHDQLIERLRTIHHEYLLQSDALMHLHFIEGRLRVTLESESEESQSLYSQLMMSIELLLEQLVSEINEAREVISLLKPLLAA